MIVGNPLISMIAGNPLYKVTSTDSIKIHSKANIIFSFFTKIQRERKQIMKTN